MFWLVQQIVNLIMCVYYFKQTDEVRGRDESGQSFSPRLMKRLVNLSESCMYAEM
jgi:hypothetical protein